MIDAMALDRSNEITISIEGPATIYEVKALREMMRQALRKPGSLKIDLGESGKWDLAGLQLLISCVRAGQSDGRTVRLLRVPRLCTEVAERSGLAQWLNSVTE
jgi:ABC-type transporter Mla MlaB component